VSARLTNALAVAVTTSQHARPRHKAPQLATLRQKMNEERDEGFAGRVDQEERVRQTIPSLLIYDLAVTGDSNLSGRSWIAVLTLNQRRDLVRQPITPPSPSKASHSNIGQAARVEL
jgi:hypothetical protein